jgi:hypothetical protein
MLVLHDCIAGTLFAVAYSKHMPTRVECMQKVLCDASYWDRALCCASLCWAVVQALLQQ